MTPIRRTYSLLLLCLAAALLAGCSSFINNAHKSIYAAAQLGDATMKGYATYWKSQTNQVGDTAALEQQRQEMSDTSRKVGASLAVADQALGDYEAKAGTNPPTQAVVTALISTAVQDAGKFAATVGYLTGNTNLLNLGK